MSKKLKKYECELCTEKMTDNYRVICPFCNVEICETCFQYSITMELKNPICLYCKKQLTLEFVLFNLACLACAPTLCAKPCAREPCARHLVRELWVHEVAVHS